MWLDDLKELVATLRERIEKQGDVLRKNESATRYALVDPLLRALGWDLENPSEVVPEYSPGKGYADYGMMVGRTKPRLIVEAKSLGTPTRQGIDQAVGYCVSQGIEYFAVTNGEMWEIYEPFRPVPIDEKLITSFDLRGPEHETVLKMLWLWRGNFVVGKPSEPATHPPSDRDGPVGGVPPPPSPERWLALSGFHPPVRTPAPSKIRFPDGVVLEVTAWRDLQVTVVRWLQQTKKLGPSNCPLRSARGADLVSTRKARSDGSRFLRPLFVDGLYVEANRSALDHTRAARRILLACDVNAAEVHVLPRSD